MSGEESLIPAIQKGVRKAWRPMEFGTTEWWRDFRRFIKETPCPGEAYLEPSRVRAGRREYLTLTFRVGEGGIKAYGHIAVECPIPNLEVLRPDTVLAAGRAYISASCTNPKPKLDITYSAGIIDILIMGYPLREGDEVKIYIGDPRGNPPLMPLEAQKYVFYIAVDRDNTGVYRRISKFPVLEVVGDCASSFDVIAPAIQKPGETFNLTVVAADKHNHNPDPYYEGEVKVFSSSPEIPPLTFKASKGSRGVFSIPLSLPSDGVYYFTVFDPKRGISGLSNPVSTNFFGEYRVYFGDIHGHNVLCDGRGTIDEYYQWARDVRRLDFAALTPHVEGAKRYDVEDFWGIVQRKVKEYYEPHKFVTLLGFEWGSWTLFGDKCVYYLDDEGPYFPANEEESNTPEKLWKLLEGREAITIPHHTKYGGRTDWSFMNSEFQRVVEIYSLWGCSEKYGEHSVQAALAMGHRLGIIASSDTHKGQPAPINGGLAAVIAKELTREGVFYALKNRRCYGTTGARILLRFEVNGHVMGEEFKVDSGSVRRRVYVRVAGTAPVEKAYIIRNNEEVKVFENLGRVAELTFVDEEPFKDTVYYYVRIVQEDGQMAWSSPIWVDVKRS